MNMVRTGKLFAISLVIAIASINPVFAEWDPAKVKTHEAATREALVDFMTTDPSLDRFFQEAHGYAVFPEVGAGALIIGGAHGKGEVFELGNYIGQATITEVSVGFSAGAKKFREIIFFKSKAALDKFKENKFSFSTNASAVAADKGAAAGVVWSDDIAVFVKGQKGLMADASVSGQRFKFEKM